MAPSLNWNSINCITVSKESICFCLEQRPLILFVIGRSDHATDHDFESEYMPVEAQNLDSNFF
jgi:hypothetical protein